MNCKNCGFPLTNDNKTCPSCGTLNENYIEKEVLETPVEQVKEQSSFDDIFTPNNTVVTEEVSAYKEPKKKNTALIVILIIVGLLVLGLGVFFSIRFLVGRIGTLTPTTVTPSKQTTNNQTTNTSSNKDKGKRSNVKVYVVFDNMTIDEIVDNIFKLQNISAGESAYYFTDRFILPENAYILSNKEHKFGTNPRWSFVTYSKEGYMTQVLLQDIKEEDDGTITFSRGAYIDPYMHFADLEKAEEVYKALYDKYKLMGTIVKESNHDNGMSTKIEIGGETYMLGLYHHNNIKQVHIQLPIE